ncbi:MAG TPA: GDP-mannose 4,6-dehydratase [Fibrobacteria bacterium]|nr:GDP-mannose 4,6-dehydratase [Fibrobacteria bacterium]
MSKVLVTGASGFAGRWMVRLLLARGYDVVGGVRRLDETSACPEILMDMEDPSSVFAGIKEIKPEAIIHLAAMASPHLSNDRPEAAYQVNFLGAHRLLEACRVLGLSPKVVLAGSATVYGKVDPAHLPLREDSPVRPTDAYSLAKASAEMLAGVFANSVPVVVARPFNHTGPGQGTDFVLPAAAAQIASIEVGRKEPILQLGDLSSERDFLDVRDVVEAYLLLLEKGLPGEVYNICSGTCKPVQDWISELAGLSRVPMEVRTEPSRVFARSNPRLVGDNSRLGALGWTRRIDASTMLSDLLDHWRGKTIHP